MRPSEALAEVVARHQLLKHPFYVAWTEGKLHREQLARYSVQYYAQVRAFPRWVSAVHSRCPDIEARKVLLRNLVDEELSGADHPELWLRFSDALGVNRDHARDAHLLPETQATVDALYELTSGSWTRGLCALFAYESQVPEVSVSKMDGLRRFYGIDDDRATSFFRAHVHYDVEHSKAVAALIDRHADVVEAVPAAEAAAKALWGFLDGAARDCAA
jgi:pyrroloquinoline-quinone synthase